MTDHTDHLVVTQPDGRAVRITTFFTAYGSCLYEVTDASDGSRVAHDCLLPASNPDQTPAGYTHRIGNPPVWLTAEDAADVEALGRAAKAAFAASEEGQQLEKSRRARERADQRLRADTAVLRTDEGRELVAARTRLVNRINSLHERDARAKDAAYDDEGGDPGFYYRVQAPKLEAQIEEASEALTTFDRQHPEIIAALEAEKQDRIRRAMDL
ncbi:hypothetical protein [Streptomyces sp. NPDC049879]|uniref:hypothetical protein n=1 Tax=Streptomyces sp. NPDC049879 TaxID=3365598 RepID=UPI003795A066